MKENRHYPVRTSQIFQQAQSSSYDSIIYFWLSSLEYLIQKYSLNRSEIAMVARSLGNYTFTNKFIENAKAFNYARFKFGEMNALARFSRWSFGNSQSELSNSSLLICHKLISKGVFEVIEYQEESYFELSHSVIDWLRYSAWETKQSLH